MAYLEIIVGLLIAILVPMYVDPRQHQWAAYAAPVGVALAVYSPEVTDYFVGVRGSTGEMGGLLLQAGLFGVTLYLIETYGPKTGLERFEDGYATRAADEIARDARGVYTNPYYQELSRDYKEIQNNPILQSELRADAADLKAGVQAGLKRAEAGVKAAVNRIEHLFGHGGSSMMYHH